MPAAFIPFWSRRLKAIQYNGVVSWSAPVMDVIAYNTQSSLYNSTGTTRSFSHTTSGTNRILFVGILTTTSLDVITSVTYAGNAMTRVWWAKLLIGTEWSYLYYINNPTIGANNVTINTSSSTTVYANAVSYTWANQSGINASATNVITNVSWPQTSVTTTVDNCWLVWYFRSNPNNQTVSAGTTFRSWINLTMFVADSNWPKSPAGSHSLWMSNLIQNWIHVVAAFWPWTL